jgi:succinyl-CoA synthetase beta subunit
MNLHEFQGKEMLSSFGVRIQRGLVAENSDEAVECAKNSLKLQGQLGL